MNPILIDVMIGNRFVCQLKYDKRGWPQMVDGKIVETHRAEDIEAFVYQQRPSLKGKDITIKFSEQRV